MNDDDLWNIVLGNDGSGPLPAPFAGGVGSPPPNLGTWDDTGLPVHIIATLPPARQDTAPVSLSALLESGIPASVIATLLPQRDDTSAATLPPSALEPPGALYDPNPPTPTMAQLALTYGLSPQQVATIQNQAITQAGIQVGSKYLLGLAADLALPELGVPKYIAKLPGLAIDITNHISEPSDEQYIEDAPDQALFKQLNDSEFQAIPPARRSWIP